MVSFLFNRDEKVGKILLFNHIGKRSKQLPSVIAEIDHASFNDFLKDTTSEVGHLEICFTITYQNTEMKVSLDSFLIGSSIRK